MKILTRGSLKEEPRCGGLVLPSGTATLRAGSDPPLRSRGTGCPCLTMEHGNEGDTAQALSTPNFSLLCPLLDCGQGGRAPALPFISERVPSLAGLQRKVSGLPTSDIPP